MGDAAKNLLAQAMSEARARAAVAGSAVAGDAPEGAGGPGPLGDPGGSASGGLRWRRPWRGRVWQNAAAQQLLVTSLEK